MQATNKRPQRRYPVAPIVMCLVLAWASCLHGDDTKLLAAAVPLPRRPAATSSVAAAGGMPVVVGYRPRPQAGAAAGRSAPRSTAWIGDDKRQIPSCPDALHNRAVPEGSSWLATQVLTQNIVS
ncbi:uncharacterized protein [Zea mays]|nr:uncharacterized protein LOC100278900 isoform X1 [Zea mays]|eukprot:XP_008672675.1 uncharacterized protein LOC100278900 isoform X1 [Zea mays]